MHTIRSFTAALHPVAALPAIKTVVQVEVVEPPVNTALVALARYPCGKLNVIFPLVIGTAVEVENARVNVPVVVVPGIMSVAGTDAVAVPLPLAVPAVSAGTVLEPAVSMIALTEEAVATV